MPVPREADLTLFAAIRIDRDRPVSDLDRFIAIALPSFSARFTPGMVREVVVVVPPSDVREATARLDNASILPIRVVNEDDLVGGLDGTAGWIKQQILKLAAPAVIDTPWFITLDADVVATRAIDHEFLFPNERAIWEQEPYSAHLSWWEASARLLGVAGPSDPGSSAFGVTPAIMHTDTVRGLAMAIEERHPGRPWNQTLVALHDAGWTEYTLYWTHVMVAGLAEELYSDVDRIPYALDGSVWTPGDLPSLDLAHVFDPDANHAFFVFQSNLELPLDQTVQLLRPYIQTDANIAAHERRQWSRHSRQYRSRSVRRRVVRRIRRALGR
jgi:hypothetical protein